MKKSSKNYATGISTIVSVGGMKVRIGSNSLYVYNQLLNNKKSMNNTTSSNTNNARNILNSAVYDSTYASGRREMPIVPKDNVRLYHETWNSHCSFTGDFDMSGVDEMAEKLAQKFIENGFQYAETSEKTGGFKAGMATLLAVQKARVPLQAKSIDKILEENGISLTDGEKYNIAVDKECKITVYGDDTEKAKKMEEILNDEPYLGWQLNRLTNLYSPRYKVKDSEEYDTSIFHEMDSESTLKVLSNGELSLKDLSIENGKIMGLTPKLDGLIHRTNTDMDNDEKIMYEQIYKVLKKVLERGIDNIPDLTTDAVYQKGKLALN